MLFWWSFAQLNNIYVLCIFSVNDKYNKSGITSTMNHLQTSVTTTTSKLDHNEPPTKLIKLINGSAILAPMDKDKMLHSGQLTLSQVKIFVRKEHTKSIKFFSNVFCFIFLLGCRWWWPSGMYFFFIKS